MIVPSVFAAVLAPVFGDDGVDVVCVNGRVLVSGGRLHVESGSLSPDVAEWVEGVADRAGPGVVTRCRWPEPTDSPSDRL